MHIYSYLITIRKRERRREMYENLNDLQSRTMQILMMLGDLFYLIY